MKDPYKHAGYDYKLPSGRSVRVKTFSGLDEEKLSKLRGVENDAVSAAMLVRIEALDGKPPTLAEVKALGMRDRSFIRDEVFSEIDGGVDTSLDITCAFCDHEWRTGLEIGQQGFFFPARQLKVWKTRSST